MRCKRTVKIIIDIAMYLLFVALMQEHLWEDLHEWIGIMLFVLFIAHNVLNFRWYQSLFKGKYTPARILSAVINIALVAAVLCCMVSSVLVSGKVFAFLNLGGARIGRAIHLVATAWAFVLMSLHLGPHLTPLTNKLKKNNKLLRAGQILAVFMCLSAEPFTKNCFISPSLSFLIPINRQFYTFLKRLQCPFPLLLSLIMGEYFCK